MIKCIKMYLFTSMAVVSCAAYAAKAPLVTSSPQELQAAGGAGVTSVVSGEAAMRCDTCVDLRQMMNSAARRLPLARNTTVYVINLESGQIGGVYLNYLAPGEQDMSLVSVDPIVQQWVQQVSDVYKANGRSLELRLVTRADGSVYWVKANGSFEQLKAPDSAIDALSVPMKALSLQSSAGSQNPAPIDLRGYQFNEPSFTAKYPTFPASSYMSAFNFASNIEGFVRDQVNGINQGAATGVISGSISTTVNGGLTTPVASATGGTTVTQNLTSTVHVYVPMKDGGFALVSYDKATGVITVLKLEDAAGNRLPTNTPPLAPYLENSQLNFPNTKEGNDAYDVFRGYLLDRGIPVISGPPVVGAVRGCVGIPGQEHCTWIY